MMHKTSQVLARQQEAEKNLPPVVSTKAEAASDDLSDIGSVGSGAGMDDSGSSSDAGKKREMLDESARSEQVPTKETPGVLDRMQRALLHIPVRPNDQK